jgi:hypothetical protein
MKTTDYWLTILLVQGLFVSIQIFALSLQALYIVPITTLNLHIPWQHQSRIYNPVNMSFSTETATVVYPKGWDSTMEQHPMGVFMHQHCLRFDAKKYDGLEVFFNFDKFRYVKSNGESFTGKQAFDQGIADYGMFADYAHEPTFGVFTPNADGGYRLFGYAKLYVDLPGSEGVNNTHEDLKGRKWEIVAHGAFIFDVEKADDSPFGFRLTYQQTFADPTPILGEAIKRGLIKPENLVA